MDPISCIFHEKQEGSLCAQHCLNTLLQGQYFSPVDLAEIARQLDESERERMAEGGTQTAEYINFLEQPSSNFDDSGFFSIQVISCALRVWNVDLVPFSSQDEVAMAARKNPTEQKAFICNFREHWFTIRKTGCQWFNLNSLLVGPELISNTYLSLFLIQLQQEGYSIFVLVGILPECNADEILSLVQVEQPIKPRLIAEKTAQPSADMQTDDAELERAINESKMLNERDDRVLQKTLNLSASNDERALIQRALEMSMIDFPSTSRGSTCSPTMTDNFAKGVNLADLRERRLTHLFGSKGPDITTLSPCPTSLNESDAIPTPVKLAAEQLRTQSSDTSTEEEMLAAAIRMSMEQP